MQKNQKTAMTVSRETEENRETDGRYFVTPFLESQKNNEAFKININISIT